VIRSKCQEGKDNQRGWKISGWLLFAYACFRQCS